MNTRKIERTNRAIARAAERAARTPAEQLKHLDTLLGAGKGAKRERVKLTLVKSAPAPEPVPVAGDIAVEEAAPKKTRRSKK